MKKTITLAGVVFLLVLLTGCRFKKEVLLSGNTMGTFYHIKVVTNYFDNTSGLQEKIDKRLKTINMSMSTYEKDSEISKFNSITNTSERLHVSEDFFYVMTVAAHLFKLSKGAWDGTVKPLVNLWGFGNTAPKNKIPTKAAIDRLLAAIGFGHIEMTENRYLRKRKAHLSLDLSSIAKGYAVDQIAALISDSGTNDFLVDIGGEVYASGYKKNGRRWRVGINRPAKDAPYNQVYKSVTLHNHALATSGDYRNFFAINGKRYSHVIDPRTGYPVDNTVVSVSITADTCTFADGLATAVMVLGHIKGLELVDSLDKVEAMIIFQKKDGTFVDYDSNGFNLLNKKG